MKILLCKKSRLKINKPLPYHQIFSISYKKNLKCLVNKYILVNLCQVMKDYHFIECKRFINTVVQHYV